MKKYIYKKMLRYINDPYYRFDINSMLGLYNFMCDSEYLKKRYKLQMGTALNLRDPQTFNEKLQWLKLYDRNPQYTIMADKHCVKEYVSQKIGTDYVIPSYGIWDNPKNISWDSLPNQFVLKCTHDSAGLVICKDKSNFDKKSAEGKLSKALKRNYYYYGREWVYRDIQPKIIAEKYLEESDTKELRDYKFFCFNGKVELFKIDFGRFSDHHANYYDRNGKMLNINELYCPPDPEANIEIPSNLLEMIQCAEILSKEIPFLRVDLYNVAGKIYFGELTFYPASGFCLMEPRCWDKKMGDLIVLPNTSFS